LACASVMMPIRMRVTLEVGEDETSPYLGENYTVESLRA